MNALMHAVLATQKWLMIRAGGAGGTAELASQ